MNHDSASGLCELSGLTITVIVFSGLFFCCCCGAVSIGILARLEDASGNEIWDVLKYPLRLSALALVVATAVGIAAFVPQMNSAAPQLIGMQAATQDTALPQAVCWSAPHSGMVALAVVAIFAITYCAIHFKVVYGSRVFLGSQPRFAFLLVVLKLVVCGICTLFSSHAEVCGATLLLASAVLLLLVGLAANDLIPSSALSTQLPSGAAQLGTNTGSSPSLPKRGSFGSQPSLPCFFFSESLACS